MKLILSQLINFQSICFVVTCLQVSSDIKWEDYLILPLEKGVTFILFLKKILLLKTSVFY
ncbi:hypothetical protein AW734_22065 (plasmid) [Pantoea ananatis]|nr:hypothetical protein AW734_22065 [Pantoea ananatis]